MGSCHCGAAAVVKGRCRTCYGYWRRTGRERPTGHVYRARQAALTRELEQRWQRDLLRDAGIGAA